MKNKAIVFFTCLSLAGYLMAQDFGVTPRPGEVKNPITYPAPDQGTRYDGRTGILYSYITDKYGVTEIKGTKIATGATCQATVKKDGDMFGINTDGQFWIYVSKTKMFHNITTGESNYEKQMK